MKILILAASPARHGMGHLCRCRGLLQEARRLGHSASLSCHITRGDPPYDWIVWDSPEPPPEAIRPLGRRLCLLNGVGLAPEAEGADLVVIQGFSEARAPNILSGPEYVVLRPEVRRLKPKSSSYWFIWGGHGDPLGLGPVALGSLEEPACYWFAGARPGSLGSRAFLEALAFCRSALISMGMIAWELAYLGKPFWIVSRSELHLSFARPFAENGIARVWPAVGLPSPHELADWLRQPPICYEPPLDGLGAARVLKMMAQF